MLNLILNCKNNQLQTLLEQEQLWMMIETGWVHLVDRVLNLLDLLQPHLRIKKLERFKRSSRMKGEITKNYKTKSQIWETKFRSRTSLPSLNLLQIFLFKLVDCLQLLESEKLPFRIFNLESKLDRVVFQQSTKASSMVLLWQSRRSSTQD